jgi:hypothetical protein
MTLTSHLMMSYRNDLVGQVPETPMKGDRSYGTGACRGSSAALLIGSCAALASAPLWLCCCGCAAAGVGDVIIYKLTEHDFMTGVLSIQSA